MKLASRNSSVTIKKILAAAAAEFAAKGIDATKIEHIARRAGISKQLIYHYFSGKDRICSELLTSIARENFDKLLQIDFAGLGRALGVESYNVRTLSAFKERLAAGIAGNKPMLIELEIANS